MEISPWRTWSVFASHSKKQDHTPKLVRLVQTHLACKGYTTFVDCDALHHISKQNLETAIADSHAFVVFLDDTTLESPWCQHEILFAVNLRLPIFVVVDVDRYRIPDLIAYWRDQRKIKIADHLFGANTNQVIGFSWDHVELLQAALKKIEAGIQRSVEEQACTQADDAFLSTCVQVVENPSIDGRSKLSNMEDHGDVHSLDINMSADKPTRHRATEDCQNDRAVGQCLGRNESATSLASTAPPLTGSGSSTDSDTSQVGQGPNISRLIGKFKRRPEVELRSITLC
jgi:hypothetical protein